ncbi:MAG: Gfo/Idh/MocA family oxidoreductase [Clostridia bacterium]|nr:Gfo/Idh/MocA family oxidoreductase [Clostridia bacterium]
MKLNQFGETVRLAVLGLGSRGVGQLKTLLEMPDVDVTAVCDSYQDRADHGAALVNEARGHMPFISTDAGECIDRSDVDAVVIMTSWETHIPLCIQAMRAGKRPAMEVGGATSIDECWRLVRVSEETGIPVMMLENCCYGDTELTLLRMVREGVFGTLVHCAGAYSHDLRDEIGNGDINRHYRQRHFLHRNAELYPTHELGPIANYLNINRGNRMVTLSAMSSKAAGLHEWLQTHRPDSPLANAQVNEGDVVTTMIRCANGETIVLTHDCTLPRFYSRGGVIRGTKGMWMEDGRLIYIEGRTPVDEHDWAHRPENDKKYMEEYLHPLWKEYRDFGIRGNHDGMDYLVLRAFIESVQNQSEVPIDVYDAAAWMSVTALSEATIAGGGVPIAVPDFTSGRWCAREKSAVRTEFEL